MDDLTRREAAAVAAGAVGVALIGGPAEAGEPRPQEAAAVKGQEAAALKGQEAALQEGSEFILKLNGIKLPPEAEKRIATELQGALLRELARIDTRGALAFRIPNRDWFGIWIERPIRGVELPVLRASDKVR